MLMDIWARIGEFVSENYMVGTIVGLILLAIAMFAQIVVNGSLEEDLIDAVERLEELEKKFGIEVCEEQESETKEEK